MLSGKFAVRLKKNYGEYLYKKIITLGIPILICFVIRTYIQGGGYAENILSGFSRTDYWFLYVLLGNVLIAPLLAPAFLSLSNQNCTIFISIALFVNLLITVFSNIGIGFSWQFIFSGWVFYFYLGSCVERYFDVSLFSKVISAATLISFLLTVILSLAGISGKIYDYSPLYAIYSVGIYYALIRLRRDIIGKCTIFDDFVCFLAKHSFVMYLAHMTLIDKITKLCQSLFFNLNPLVHYICLSTFVFLSTLIVSVLLNTFIIDPLVKYSVNMLRIRNF